MKKFVELVEENKLKAFNKHIYGKDLLIKFNYLKYNDKSRKYRLTIVNVNEFYSEKLEELIEIYENIDKDYILVNGNLLKKTQEDVVKIFEMYGDIPLKDVLINYFKNNKYICFEKKICGFYTRVNISKTYYIGDDETYIITGVFYSDVLYFNMTFNGFDEMMKFWLNLEKDYEVYYLTQLNHPTLIKKDECEVYKMLQQNDEADL
jgi:hypothetical protein